MKLFTLIEGLKTTGISGDLSLDIRGIAYHSAEVRPGYLFVAIKGTHHDGHNFIAAAIQQGAAAVIAEELIPEETTVTWVQVDDSREALGWISARWYDDPSQQIKVVGITGTNGKTTTTFLLESIFRRAHYTVGVIGTINYRFGNRIIEASTTTPQSLGIQKLLAEMAREGVSHVVMEVSSHAVDQRRIAGVHFDVGVFTNITSEHLDYHGTIEEYAKCKAMFFSHFLINSESRKPKYAVINQDDPYADYFASRTAARIIRYGLGKDVDITVVEEHVSSQGIAGRLKTPDGDIRFRSPLLGRFNLCNIMAAAGVAYTLGIPLESVRAGIETCTSVPGRMERVGENIDYTVIVDYAHTPDALEKVLHSIREFVPQRIIAVFGCGGDRDRLKRPVMGEIAAMLADVVIVTSDNPRRERPEHIMGEIEAGIKRIDMPKMDGPLHETDTGYMMVVDREEAIRTALSLARKGDVILVAGKGHEAYQAVGDRRIPFDDRLKVVKLLQERSLC